MPERLVIRYDGVGQPLRVWRTTANGEGFVAVRPDAASRAPGLPVWVIVPAECVGYARTRLAIHQRDQLMRAVPFALEDQIAEPIESLQFAISSGVEGSQEAWWIGMDRLRAWLEDLASRSVRPEVLLSEAALAATSGESESPAMDVWTEDGGRRVVLVQGETRTALPPEIWEEWQTANADAVQTSSSPAGEPLESMLLRAAARAPVRPDGNLLAGTFAPHHATAPLRRLWRVAALLAVAAGALWTGWLYADTLRLEQRRAALTEQQRDTYRSVVPGAVQIPDPAGQMRALVNGQGGNQDDFFALTSEAASLLGSMPQLHLEQLDWNAGTLELTLIGPDVSTLDAYRERCAQLPGLEADLGTVGNVPGGSRGRVSVRRSATR